ncbi:DUF3426 domain-containing protein [Thauera mechernichensis]
MMLTRCPACQTVFRLRPEQLHARRGEVRCGHCFHPFNAPEHAIEAPPAGATHDHAHGTDSTAAPASRQDGALQAREGTERTGEAFFALGGRRTEEPSAGIGLDFEIPDFHLPDLPDAPTQPPARPPADSKTDPVEAPLAFDPVFDPAFDTAPAPVQQRHDPLPPVWPAADVLTNSQASPLGHDSQDERRTAPTPMPGVLRSGRRGTEALHEAGIDAAPGDQLAAAPFAHDEAFERAMDRTLARAEPRLAADAAAQRALPIDEGLHSDDDIRRLDATYGKPRHTPHPAARAAATLAFTVLLFLLGAQLTYLYRVEIARELPGLRTVLSAACAHAGCTVPYPRDADRIAIDSSDLQSEPGRPGHYLLHATLNNRADYPQQWPHLELTLTDAGDNPISRRVLAPSDWLPAGQVAPAFPARNVVGLRIPFAAPGLAPTGYRIYAFFP